MMCLCISLFVAKNKKIENVNTWFILSNSHTIYKSDNQQVIYKSSTSHSIYKFTHFSQVTSHSINKFTHFKSVTQQFSLFPHKYGSQQFFSFTNTPLEPMTISRNSHPGRSAIFRWQSVDGYIAMEPNVTLGKGQHSAHCMASSWLGCMPQG